jgi:hypothetical protein
MARRRPVRADQREGGQGRACHQRAGDARRGQRPGDAVPAGTARVAESLLNGGRRPAGGQPLSARLSQGEQVARLGRAQGRGSSLVLQVARLDRAHGGGSGLVLDETAHDGLGEPAGLGLEGAYLGQ